MTYQDHIEHEAQLEREENARERYDRFVGRAPQTTNGGMISQATAERIWNAYREISAGEKLLSDMEQAAKEFQRDEHAARLKDVYGRRRNLQLGVPSGESCHTIFQVSPKLAESVIRAHIANKHSELAEANEQARIELDGTEVE